MALSSKYTLFSHNQIEAKLAKNEASFATSMAFLSF